jgi:hypothetical protein
MPSTRLLRTDLIRDLASGMILRLSVGVHRRQMEAEETLMQISFEIPA